MELTTASRKLLQVVNASWLIKDAERLHSELLKYCLQLSLKTLLSKKAHCLLSLREIELTEFKFEIIYFFLN